MVDSRPASYGGGDQAIELEYVRRAVAILFFWLPRLLPAMLRGQAAKATHLIDLVGEFFTDPPPAALAFLISVPLVLLHAKDPALEELRQHLGALEPQNVERELGSLVGASG